MLNSSLREIQPLQVPSTQDSTHTCRQNTHPHKVNTKNDITRGIGTLWCPLPCLPHTHTQANKKHRTGQLLTKGIEKEPELSNY